MAEFIEDIGDLCLVCVVVEKDDHALGAEDHFSQRGPIICGKRDLGRGVRVAAKAAGFEGSGVVAYADGVGVAKEDGEDVVRVPRDPGCDGAEV